MTFMWYLMTFMAADDAMRVVVFHPDDWLWKFSVFVASAVVSFYFCISNARRYLKERG